MGVWRLTESLYGGDGDPGGLLHFCTGMLGTWILASSLQWDDKHLETYFTTVRSRMSSRDLLICAFVSSHGPVSSQNEGVGQQGALFFGVRGVIEQPGAYIIIVWKESGDSRALSSSSPLRGDRWACCIVSDKAARTLLQYPNAADWH